MDIGEFARELERRFSLLSGTTIRPSDLAYLFRFAFSSNPHAVAMLHVLHEFLLKRTIEHARTQTEFYARDVYRSWSSTAPGERLDLNCWPIIGRSDVIEHFDQFLARDVTFESSCHTSGSTGPSLNVYKSSQELAFLWAYYNQLMEPAFKQIARRPLVLSFPNLYHGVPVRLPGVGRVFISGVTDDTLINDALRVLEKRYRIEGHDEKISIISGLSFHIKFFTSFLIERGYDPKDFGIHTLTIVGEYVSSLSRRFLASAWGAQVFERFTLTESIAGADRCLRCGLFHFDPHVIAEVVDADTRQAIEEGVGHLVLTQLHPFVQMQPFIRYETGDVVRTSVSECGGANITFDFLGKASNCVRFRPEGRTEWLIFSVDLHEIINPLPDIRLHDTFVNVRSVRDTTVGSPPIFTLKVSPADARPFRIELTIELRYAPHFFPDRTAELQILIRRKLLSASAALARRVEEGLVDLEIDFVGPGALGGEFKIKV